MKRLVAKFRKDERGLTLVEMLAVIVILAIVAGIAFVLIGNVIENSKKDAHISNALNLIAAAKLYQATGGDFDENNQITLKKLQDEKLMDTVYDPWEQGEYNEASHVKKVKKVKKGDDDDDEYDEYTATLETDNAEDCALTDVPESVLLKGRGEACNYTP